MHDMQESTDVWIWRGVHHMRSAQTLTHCVYVCAIYTYVFFVLGSGASQNLELRLLVILFG